ncbi:MAG: protein kinase [Polyangiaceae bacterium]|nr:protein kinase [Polyangiaceae bacterium]
MAQSTADFRACPHCGTACARSHQYCPACGFPVGTLGVSDEDKFIGKTLPGGYHILDLISVGGMGRVYRAEQSVLGRTVAVKIIHPHLLSDENSAVRFMTEARAASQLNHPNSVAVFDFGRTDDGQPYLVMEFLRGKDLARVAYDEGPLPFGRIVDVLKQVLTALAEAHELGIVHRDLKPENVIIEPLRRGGDSVKVVDFGLAKLKADRPGPSVTSPGIVCGTPDYMAPEQGRGDVIDGRSDLYAVGVMFFQLLTGQLPYEADSPTQVVMMHMTMPIPDPQQVAPERDIPDALCAVVKRAMAKAAKDRYQDATEFAEALSEALALTQTSAAASLSPGLGTVQCQVCRVTVPIAKFCGECGSRLTSVSGPPSATPQFPLPLVGREEALSWLEQQRNRASGTLFAARLVAESGFGKTRVLSEFARALRARGECVIEARPDPYLADVANYSLRKTITELSAIDEVELKSGRFDGASPEAKRGLAEIFALKGQSPDRRMPAERRYALAEALRWALELGLTRQQTQSITILVDDLHRMDGASRNAFTDMIAAPPMGNVFLVGAHVPAFDPRWGGVRSAAHVLAGLSESTAEPILRFLKPQERPQPDPETHDFQPLYLEQAVRYAASGGTDAPPRLGDLVGRRLDTLEPMARRVLQAIVVLGDDVRPQDIPQLVTSLHDSGPTVERLVQEGFVQNPNGLISASHPLLREIVLTGIPHAVRRELHDKALRVCEKVGAPLEARAQHAYFCQDSFQALLLLEQVAERAQANGALDSEILALRRGLEIARQEISRGELDDPLRAVLIFSRKLGAALARAGSLADAEGVLREALDLAGPNGKDRARVLGALAQVAHGRQRASEAFGYLDQAIEAAKSSGEKDLVSSLSDTRTAWAS